MQYRKKSLSKLHEKIRFWQPKPDNSCKNWRVPFIIQWIKVCTCDHTYLMRNHWKNQTKIPKNRQIMAILRFEIAVSCNLTYRGNLRIFCCSPGKKSYWAQKLIKMVGWWLIWSLMNWAKSSYTFMMICTVNTMKIINKVEFIGQNWVFSAFSHMEILMTAFAKMAINF